MDLMEPTFDLCCVGNAIVDILAPVAPGFVVAQQLAPGSMTLIDAEQAERLETLIVPVQQTSGGSAANSCVVASLLGARVAYLGKVADDKAGLNFRRDLEAAGITFPSTPLPRDAAEGRSTARCIIMVTPDGQRTMSTYLGACTAFSEEDVLADIVRGSRITYLEGYLFDPPQAQRAFLHAAEIAHRAGRQVALSLSDPFCVGRHRAAFRDLVKNAVDILFANEDEILSLYETEDFEDAAAQAASEVGLAALTRAQAGSVIMAHGQRIAVSAQATHVVDSTGAGDAYAAGFLAGLTAARPLAECGRIGTLAASEIISHYGARPEMDLRRVTGL